MLIYSMIYTKISCKLTVNIPYFQINKRFYPGPKEIGHATKILNKINSYGNTSKRYHRSMYNSKKQYHSQFRKLRHQYVRQDHQKSTSYTKSRMRYKELQAIQDKSRIKGSNELNHIKPDLLSKNAQEMPEHFSPLSKLTKTFKSVFTSIGKKTIGIKKEAVLLSVQNKAPLLPDTNNIINQEITVVDPTLPSLPIPFGVTNNTIQKIEPSSISTEESNSEAISSEQKNITKLKNPVGTVYESFITPFTRLEDVPRDTLITELIIRHLIKKTKSPAVIIETEKDGYIRVGNKENDYVFTKQGIAYLELQQKQNQVFMKPPAISTELFTLADIDNLRIIVIKEQSTAIVQQSTHMIGAYDPNNNRLYAFSMFTSEKIGFKLCEEQFKKFQMKKQGKIFTKEEESKDHNMKVQHLRIFNNIKIFEKNEVHEVKFDKDYFRSLNQDQKNDLVLLYNNLKNQPYEKYIPQNVSNEQLLQMCKDVDAEASKKKPKHPVTLEAQQKQQQAKTNQMEKQQQAKANQIKK